MEQSNRLETTMSVAATLLVDDVMRQWPLTIRAFLNRKMHCVGCPITCFHTISDACREHGVDQAGFLAELSAIIAQAPDPSTVREPAPISARWPA
jgi:hybrid cluster-associated redox disulfide protein